MSSTKLEESALKRLYIKERISSLGIAKRFGVSTRTVLNYLEKYKIPRRTLSEAATKYLKRPFCGVLKEKAYLIGLRAGDIYARWNHKQVRIKTTTTHLSQIIMIRRSFGKYGHVAIYPFIGSNKKNQWRVECDLHDSFTFLLKKPSKIPKWILKEKDALHSFLAGYMDCEGTWDTIKINKNNTKFGFRIRTGDKKILLGLKEKLEEFGYNPTFRLEMKRGTKTNVGKCNKDLFALSIFRKSEVLNLAYKLLYFSRHPEKIRRMRLILKIGNKNWDEVKTDVLNMRKLIKREHIDRIKLKR